MSENILRVENVTMQFGGVVAVDNLSFEVNDDEIVSIIGPNGAGKTTVFNAITGVYEPTNGRIEYCGKTMLENFPKGKMKKLYKSENQGLYTKTIVKTPDEITKLGIARTFQNIRLFKTMTVFENVLVAKHLRRTSNIFTATFMLNAKEEKKPTRPLIQKALKLTISTFSFPHLERCATVKAATLKVVFVRQQSVVQQAANTM